MTCWSSLRINFSIKSHFLRSHVQYSPEHFGKVNEGQAFHQYTKEMKKERKYIKENRTGI